MLNLKALSLAVVIGVLSPVVPINVLFESYVLAQTTEERKVEADRLLEQVNTLHSKILVIYWKNKSSLN